MLLMCKEQCNHDHDVCCLSCPEATSCIDYCESLQDMIIDRGGVVNCDHMYVQVTCSCILNRREYD